MGDSPRTPRYLIRDLPASDRPRERLAALGARALSEAELLAILLRTGTRGQSALQLAQALLAECQGLSGLLAVPYQELCSRPGLGPAKASQIQAAVELGRRFASARPGDRPSIKSPEEAAALIQYEMSTLEQETMRVLLLDTRNHLIRDPMIYQGSLNASVVRVGELFREAVRANAAALIVAHNHPSGDPTPSPEDVAMTRTLVEGGRLLDIEVLDHLVIGKGRWVSLKAQGLGFD
jgi:DNA repair protein RadC